MFLAFILLLAGVSVLALTYSIGKAPLVYTVSLYALAMGFVYCCLMHLVGRLTMEIGVGTLAVLTLIASVVGAAWRSSQFDPVRRWRFIMRYFVALPLSVAVLVGGLYLARANGHFSLKDIANTYAPLPQPVPVDTLTTLPDHSELTSTERWSELKQQNP